MTARLFLLTSAVTSACVASAIVAAYHGHYQALGLAALVGGYCFLSIIDDLAR